MTKRIHACIYGRVQGVGFRHFVRRIALGMDISGFVRNTDDGAVEVTAEGGPRDLETLLDYLSEGPAYARVDRVEVSWQRPTDEYDGFEVRV